MSEDINERAEALKKIRDTASRFHEYFKSDKLNSDKILTESQRKYDSILNTLNDKVREAEQEKLRLEKENKKLNDKVNETEQENTTLRKETKKLSEDNSDLKKSLQTALNKNEEDDNIIDKLNKEVQGQKSYIKELESELNKSITMIEIAIVEKKKVEEKLAQLQDHWEKYVAG
ncbi:MAG: hypothetical protein HQK79_11340 [Desulfobacterales bacterium]|nr:hypothetical protein [Desulfobacterales bacterium]